MALYSCFQSSHMILDKRTKTISLSARLDQNDVSLAERLTAGNVLVWLHPKVEEICQLAPRKYRYIIKMCGCRGSWDEAVTKCRIPMTKNQDMHSHSMSGNCAITRYCRDTLGRWMDRCKESKYFPNCRTLPCRDRQISGWMSHWRVYPTCWYLHNSAYFRSPGATTKQNIYKLSAVELLRVML